MTLQEVARALSRLRAAASRLPLYDWDEVPNFSPGFSPAELDEIRIRLPGLPDDAAMFLRECSEISAADMHNGYFVGGLGCFALARSPLPEELRIGHVSVPITAIGSDGGGHRFVLALGSNNPVAKWNHETGKFTIVASSFTEFLTTMAKDWECFVAGDSKRRYLSG